MNKNSIEQLVSTMMQLGKLMKQLREDYRSEKPTTVLQFTALRLLKERDGTKVSDLSYHLKISKSSTTQLIERLVKSGLVKRVHGKKDRRVVLLIITPKGEKEFAQLRAEVIKRMSKFLSKIPEKDIDELIRIHTNIINTLKKQKYE